MVPDPPPAGEWARVKELFGAALERAPHERAAFLDRECASDVEVRREVESLLAAHDASASFLAAPAAAAGATDGTITQTTAGESGRLALGQAVGHYRVERELGAGGMAIVYLAEDLKHHRRVALKVLRPALAVALGAERFLREIEIVARLRHPHILPLYDSGQAESGALYFVMPYVEGESLRARLEREKQLPLDDALRIAREVADALSYAHAQGVVHRDIKPENILLGEDNHAVVADFGIARAVSAAGGDRLTGTGLVIGTPAYMSPEQAAGERHVDGRADIYSLGCVLYEMLGGQPPFTGPTAGSVIRQHLVSEPRLITQLRPAVPADVAAAVTRSLAKDPADRFNPVGQFAEALTRVQAMPHPTPTGIPAQPALASAPPPRRRHWWPAAVALLPVVLLAGLWVSLRGRAPTEAAAVGSVAAGPVDQKYVVAVLPFENLSADTAMAYFAAGMTEEVRGQLSRLSALRVPSRAALTPYRDAADRVPRLAKELGVGSVVEGSIRIEGGRSRVAVQLTDARSGNTVWSEQYDRPLADVLAVQSEIARNITDALRASLTPAEMRRAGRSPTVNLAAYELYMRASRVNLFDPSQNAAGIAMLRQATALDSTFAVAYAALAHRLMFLGYARGSAYMDSGLMAARKAIAVDPELAEAHFALGSLQSLNGQLAAGGSSLRKALQLDPNLARAMMDLSINEDFLGRYDESLHWAMRAVPLEPTSAGTYYHVSVPLLRLADEVTTERFLTAAVQRFPDNVRLESGLVILDLQRGRDAAAMERARRMVARHPENQEAQTLLAEVAVVTRAADAEALLQPLDAAGPDSRPLLLLESVRTLYAWALAGRGERARADSLWDAALAVDRRDLANGNEMNDRPMEVAAISAIRGDTAAALEWLERAYQAGFKDPQVVARDPFFDGLKAHPRFRKILERMKDDVAAMHRRAAAEHDTLFVRAPRR